MVMTTVNARWKPKLKKKIKYEKLEFFLLRVRGSQRAAATASGRALRSAS